MKVLEIVIVPPIKIIPSKEYALVVMDALDISHYFNEDGSYDGWSKDCAIECFNIQESISWDGSRVQCDLCSHIWIAVYPLNIDKLECPNCHNMVNYEIINDL